MKITAIAANQTELYLEDGIIVFFSYNTPVCVFAPGKGALVTTAKYSKTTTAHINKTLERWNCSFTFVNQDIIDNYIGRKE